MKVSIVSPFFNEELILLNSVKRMIHNLEMQFEDWELILVNDGSTDDSLGNLLYFLNENKIKNIKVISYPYNQGRGRAIKTGIDASFGEIIVTTEVDCSWGDDIALKMFNELRCNKKIDFVVASPHMIGGGLINVPLKRRFLSWFGNKLIQKFFYSGISMNTGMTRAYRKNVIRPLLIIEQGKEFHLEVLMKLLNLGFKFKEIPAKITWEVSKKTTQQPQRVSSTKIGKTIRSHLRFIAISNPMHNFWIISLICSIVGSMFLIWTIFSLLTSRVSIFLGLMTINIFVVSILFLGLAIIFTKLNDAMRHELCLLYEKNQTVNPPNIAEANIVYGA